MDNCPKCGLDLHGALSVTREFIAANLYIDGHYTSDRIVTLPDGSNWTEGVWVSDYKGDRPIPTVADGSDFCNVCGTPVTPTLKLKEEETNETIS